MTSFRSLACLFVGLAIPGAATAAQDHVEGHRAGEAAPGVPLYDGLGTHTYAISTIVPDAQAYFNQGMRLYYAFNHQEAIRSFREAQRLDPDCAMCWWGEALAWGPNINLPMDAEAGAEAYAAVQHAMSRSAHANVKERALIGALASRYSTDPGADRAPLDRAYAEAMRDVVNRYPADREAAVLYAEAVMTQMPWDYWDENRNPRPGIGDALRRLESVIAVDSNHPGACHFFIHAVEKHFPERAVDCAERLRGLMPAAGHLVHMPGHIYIRVGRYLDAIEVNEHAVHADETYIQDQRPGMGMYTVGYYPHNYDFLAFAASMVGRGKQGIAAAKRVQDVIPAEMLSEPGFTFAQHYATRPLQLLVRFGRWDDVLAMEAPDPSLHHARAMWHYARGRALAATGNVTDARRELEAVRRALHSAELAGLRLEFNSVNAILGIAERVLGGWIAVAEGNVDVAVTELTQGVVLNDALLYGEPPEWTIPVRHDLGAVLLKANRPQQAEQVYREDLAQFPMNGWSLYGLAQALRAQGRVEEAAEVEATFAEVWRDADVRITASAF